MQIYRTVFKNWSFCRGTVFGPHPVDPTLVLSMKLASQKVQAKSHQNKPIDLISFQTELRADRSLRKMTGGFNSF